MPTTTGFITTTTEGTTEPITITTTAPKPTTTTAEECYHGDGSTYAGTKSTTINGYTCMPWADNYPHVKSSFASTADNFPEDSLLEAQNYCRNPDPNDHAPWCYTTNAFKRWDYCDIKKCAGIYY